MRCQSVWRGKNLSLVESKRWSYYRVFAVEYLSERPSNYKAPTHYGLTAGVNLQRKRETRVSLERGTQRPSSPSNIHT